MKHRGLPSLIALTVFTIGVGAVACANAQQRVDVRQIPPGADLTITELLADVTVVPTRPNPAGYDRDCGRGAGCVFGTPWSDDHDGINGRNGCDTRNDILRVQLADVTIRPGTQQCTVTAGTLRDPYTAATVTYSRGSIEIDHVYPLALAWDLGANEWTQRRRVDFANDQRNLVATARAVNRVKSDKAPAEWLPAVAETRRCRYVAQFLIVAISYDLPIVREDAEAIRATATSCTQLRRPPR